ncbi:hypothetical protein NQZ68_004853 [Dissostichus eleginoides]|nr:hypothetical protein NQZ68_004853 [Dissostichus eleginoides]
MTRDSRAASQTDSCERGSQSSVSGSTHPSLHRTQAPQATTNPKTLLPPRDETWPCAPSPLPGACMEPPASTRLTGRRFSLKSNPVLGFLTLAAPVAAPRLLLFEASKTSPESGPRPILGPDL